MLAEILERLGEPWCYNHQHDFEIEVADKVVDFYNHGGLEWRNADTGENVNVQAAWVRFGELKIACWIWYDAQDFEKEAEWMELGEEDFQDWEISLIENKIREIYGKRD